MKEVTVNKYDLLDGTLRGQLKKTYNSVQKNMLTVATLAYKLKNQDETQFIEFAQNELNMSTPTISKFITAGRIVVENNGVVELPNSYSAVYELNKVSNELEVFAEYYEEVTDKELKDGTQKQISKVVKAYINKEEVPEESEEEKEEKEETSEENITIKNVLKVLEMLEKDVNRIEDEGLTNNYNNLLEALANIDIKKN